MKTFLQFLAHIIEHKKGIRRFIVLTAFPLWLIVSLAIAIDWLRGHEFAPSFATWYATFTSVISIIVGFYFWTRNKDGGNSLE